MMSDQGEHNKQWENDVYAVLVCVSVLFLTLHVMRCATTYGVLSWCRWRRRERTWYDKTWIVITGSTSGLGLEMALKFAESGANLFMISKSGENLTAAKRRIMERFPVRVDYFVANFAAMTARDWKLLKQSLASLEASSISMLVNNVGTSQHDLEFFGNVNWEQLQATIEVNVLATTRLTHMLLPILASWKSHDPQKLAYVVFIDSMSGRYELPVPMLSCYSATKAFLHSLSVGIQEEYDGTLNVLSVSPGIFDSGMSRKIFPKTTGSILERLLPRPSSKKVAIAIVDQITRTVSGTTAGHWSHAVQLSLKRAMCPCQSAYMAVAGRLLRRRAARFSHEAWPDTGAMNGSEEEGDPFLS